MSASSQRIARTSTTAVLANPNTTGIPLRYPLYTKISDVEGHLTLFGMFRSSFLGVLIRLFLRIVQIVAASDYKAINHVLDSMLGFKYK